jgi:AraC-like DNA-binding protein
VIGQMFLTFEDRASNSPYVERLWRTCSTTGGPFHSMAEGNLELVVTRLGGFAQVTLRGPVTQAATVDCPADGQWFAIRFRVGTYFPGLPTSQLLNHRNLHLPTTRDGQFWLEGEAWEIPGYENAEVFVTRLAKRGFIAIEPAVEAAIEGASHVLSRRSVQRHFLRATGITYAQFRKIERARRAVELLRNGTGILDVVHDAGYFDQPHLTRSLKYLIGETPMKILRNEAQLSFSYKTELAGPR